MVQLRSRGRRKVVAESSDEGEEEEHAVAKRPSQKDVTETETASPTPSPRKQTQTKKSKGKASAKPPAKTIYSFFNAATQKQSTQVPDVQQSKEIVPNTSAPDDISDDEGHTRYKPLSAIATGLKRNFASTQPLLASQTESQTSGNVRKFLKTSAESKAVPTPPISTLRVKDTRQVDTRPWTEKYSPASLDDVVVHKKKIADVRTWLEAALEGKPYKKVLVLKGPAGSGKTTMLQCLARVLSFKMVEWRNPASSDFTSQDYQSITTQFDEFLNRGRIFGGLDIAGADGQVVKDEMTDVSEQDQIILVEDFPHTVLRSGAALQTFRSSILQTLASNVAKSGKARPVVLVMSESATMGTASSTDSTSAHRLLGPDILHHPSATVIELNPVATTFIAKALKLILEKHRKSAGSSFSPSQAVITKISEIGDLRNATSTLEYLSLGRQNDILASSSVSAKAKSRSSKTKSKNPDANESDQQTKDALAYITLRESTLGLFHTTGKVLYNKRTVAGPKTEIGVPDIVVQHEDLPVHMHNLARTMAPEVDVTSLMDQAGSDVSTLLSTFHENYALSCYDPTDSADRTLGALNGCLDSLCDADILLPAMYSRGTVQEGNRQEELAFETAVGGLMLNLPYPVHRRPPPGKGKADAHRMFYPTGLKLWRRKEELLGLLDVLVDRASSGNLLEGVDLAGVRTQSISQPGGMPLPASSISSGSMSELENEPISMGSGQSARHDMLMERLPYLAHIIGSGLQSTTILRQVEEITRFTGVGALQDEDDAGKPQRERPGYSRQNQTAGFGSAFPRSKGATEDLDVKGLVLSDDDIED
jgi:cell cycle checkpoint protein